MAQQTNKAVFLELIQGIQGLSLKSRLKMHQGHAWSHMTGLCDTQGMWGTRKSYKEHSMLLCTRVEEDLYVSLQPFLDVGSYRSGRSHAIVV